jgi:hypothetical protein
MLKFKVQPYNSVWISADSQEELGRTFIRFQEFYESPNPDFKNNIFTLGMVRNWYSIKYGGDTYEKDWTGFNFPSKVLIPFKQGLFDPLTSEEIQVLDYFKYRHDNFYIIGAQDNATLRHELAHALYLYDPIYGRKIDEICTINKKEMSIVRKYIIDKGYAEDVVNDELQAYITDNDDPFIIKNTPEHILKKINKLYTKHNVAKT